MKTEQDDEFNQALFALPSPNGAPPSSHRVAICIRALAVCIYCDWSWWCTVPARCTVFTRQGGACGPLRSAVCPVNPVIGERVEVRE